MKKKWCIPTVGAEFVWRMEDVLDVYAAPYDPKRPTILFDGKFELLPLKKGRFMCISEDVGNFWLDVMEDSNGNIEGVKLIIGFSSLPFKRTRGLFWGI